MDIFKWFRKKPTIPTIPEWHIGITINQEGMLAVYFDVPDADIIQQAKGLAYLLETLSGHKGQEFLLKALIIHTQTKYPELGQSVIDEWAVLNRSILLANNIVPTVPRGKSSPIIKPSDLFKD